MKSLMSIRTMTSYAPLSLLQRAAAVLSVALLLLAAHPLMAQGQDSERPVEARWTQTFEQQVNTLLKASSTELQVRGMQLIIEFADRSDHTFKFVEARPHLYNALFNYNNPDELRILALSALHATDHTLTNRTLAEAVQDEPSVRVRRHILMALAAK